MSNIKSFQGLLVWQKSHELALKIYKLTNDFPKEERFGLVSQMRRAVVSVPANIAEGFQRRGIKDKINFYNIAQSSLNELKYYFILCKDLRYLNVAIDIEPIIDEIGKMLNGLITSVNETPNP